MTIHVSISEAKARLSRYIEQTSEENETIVIESHGNPKAVLIPYRSFEEFSTWQEAQHRKQVLENLRNLRRSVQSRNQDLSTPESEIIAEQYAQDVIRGMVAEGKINYETGDE
ncbi:MAG: type II toxin-antitoxin system Phd/YefM family antitoxin [Caldilineaceae bacterium]